MSHQQWLFFKYVELIKEKKKDYPLQFFKPPPVAPRLYEPLSFLIFLTQNDTFPKMDNEHSFVSAPLFCLCLFSMICLLNLYDQFRQTTQWTKNPFDDFLLCCQISLLRLRINFFKPKQSIWMSNYFLFNISWKDNWGIVSTILILLKKFFVGIWILKSDWTQQSFKHHKTLHKKWRFPFRCWIRPTIKFVGVIFQVQKSRENDFVIIWFAQARKLEASNPASEAFNDEKDLAIES